MKASRICAPEDWAASLRLWSSMSLNRRSSSFNSKSYQYLPRTNTPVSPYFSSRSWIPLKIFEKVSPFLKFRRLSSLVDEAALPPLTVPIRSGSAPRVDQLAPTDSDESNWPSISPILKLTPNAGAARVDARLTANGSLARRQVCFDFVIDTTPCTFLLWIVRTIATGCDCLIPRKYDLQPPRHSGSQVSADNSDPPQARNGRERAIDKANACLTMQSLRQGITATHYRVERNAQPAACHWAISRRMRFLSSLPTLVLGISVTRAICVGIAHLLI